jgi:hypothetical protein
MTSTIPNHVELALERLLEQYKRSESIREVISVFAERTQELEDALFDSIAAMYINNAEGVNLDRVGEIVGIARLGLSDDLYRIEIRAKIIRNKNSGTPEEVISAAKFFLGVTSILFYELYPAGIEIFTTAPVDPVELAKIKAAIQSFIPAGVGLSTFASYDPELGFLFNVPGVGLGDTDDPLVGGLLADLY